MKPAALSLTLLLSASLPAAAHAAGNDEARARYQEGARAFAKGDFEAAVSAFGALYRLTGDTKHLWNLALSEYSAHHTFDALSHLRAYLQKTDANPKNIERARRLIAEEEPKVAHLTIDAPAGAEISIDGATAGTAPLASSVEVDPDKPHLVVASQGVERATQNLDAPGGKGVSVHLAFPVAAPATAPPAPAPLPPPPPPATHPLTDDAKPPASEMPHQEAGGSAARIWLTVGLGVGALAAGGVAVVMGVQSDNASNSATALRASLPPGQCTNPNASGCAQLQSDVNTQQNDHVVSTALYVTAGVLAVGAVAAWLFVPHDRGSRAAIVPAVGPGFAGASGEWRF